MQELKVGASAAPRAAPVPMLHTGLPQGGMAPAPSASTGTVSEQLRWHRQPGLGL